MNTKELKKRCNELFFQVNEKTERIAELEKENAELKEALKGKVCNCMTYLNFKDLEKECAKAKDILQRLMENQPTPSSMYEEIDLVGWREVNKEAKQFLKEIK